MNAFVQMANTDLGQTLEHMSVGGGIAASVGMICIAAIVIVFLLRI